MKTVPGAPKSTALKEPSAQVLQVRRLQGGARKLLEEEYKSLNPEGSKIATILLTSIAAALGVDANAEADPLDSTMDAIAAVFAELDSLRDALTTTKVEAERMLGSHYKAPAGYHGDDNVYAIEQGCTEIVVLVDKALGLVQ